MALSTFRDAPQRIGDLREVPLYTGVKVYAGGLVCIKTAHGYGVPGATATDLIPIGIATKTVDNTSGASGALSVPVMTGCFRMRNYGSDPVTAASRGQPCFIYDDEYVAVSNGSSTRSVAGTIREVDSAGVWVEFSSVNGTSLASEIASRALLTTWLAAVDTIAADQTIGALALLYQIAVPSGATGTKTVTLSASYGDIIVTDVWFRKKGTTGGTSDTVKLTDGSNDITNSLALSTVAAGGIVRCTSISSTYGALSAGDTLVADYTNTTASCEGDLFVLCARTA